MREQQNKDKNNDEEEDVMELFTANTDWERDIHGPPMDD
jgi:hypothetical protein